MAYRWLMAGALFVAGMAAANAQAWPSKPVRIIIPVSAGSATDVTARVLADHLAQQLGQPFIVENRTGAGGTTGMGYVASRSNRTATPSWFIRRPSRSSRRLSPISATIPARTSPA